MTTRTAILVALCLLATIVFVVSGDTYFAPSNVRVYSDASGRAMCQLTTIHDSEGRPGVEVLAQRKMLGSGKIVSAWTKEYDYVPGEVRVHHSGAIVFFDEHARPGRDHAIVVISKDGKAVLDVCLSDVLSANEIREHASKSVSSVTWRHRTFDRFRGSDLQIYCEWGVLLSINVETGNVKRESVGKLRE